MKSIVQLVFDELSQDTFKSVATIEQAIRKHFKDITHDGAHPPDSKQIGRALSFLYHRKGLTERFKDYNGSHTPYVYKIKPNVDPETIKFSTRSYELASGSDKIPAYVRVNKILLTHILQVTPLDTWVTTRFLQDELKKVIGKTIALPSILSALKSATLTQGFHPLLKNKEIIHKTRLQLSKNEIRLIKMHKKASHFFMIKEKVEEVEEAPVTEPHVEESSEELTVAPKKALSEKLEHAIELLMEITDELNQFETQARKLKTLLKELHND